MKLPFVSRARWEMSARVAIEADRRLKELERLVVHTALKFEEYGGCQEVWLAKGGALKAAEFLGSLISETLEGEDRYQDLYCTEREAHAETRKELERVKLHLRELFRHADRAARVANGGILDRLRELDKAPGGLYPRAAQEDSQ